MFDRLRLRDNAILCFIMGVLLKAAGNEAATFVLAIGVMSVFLFLSFKPFTLPFNPIKTQKDKKEMLEALKDDPQARAAVMYAMELSPTELVRFGRLIVEIRSEADSRFLKDMSDIFRRSK